MDQTAEAIPVGAVSPLPLRPLLAAVNPAAPEKAAAIPHPHLVEAGVMTAEAVVVEEVAAAVEVVLVVEALTKTTIARHIPWLAPVRRTSRITRSTATVPAPAGL